MYHLQQVGTQTNGIMGKVHDQMPWVKGHKCQQSVLSTIIPDLPSSYPKLMEDKQLLLHFRSNP